MSRYVRQEDGYGCGVACLAMVTGKTYAEVKAWEGFVGKNFRGPDGGGLTYDDILQYLGDHGYAASFRWRYLPGSCTQQRNVRTPWPSLPFAPAHVVAVESGRHLVALTSAGTVLDPARPDRTRLDDCGDVSWMLGVFDVREMNGGAWCTDLNMAGGSQL